MLWCSKKFGGRPVSAKLTTGVDAGDIGKPYRTRQDLGLENAAFEDKRTKFIDPDTQKRIGDG
jgi:hypothetical protein